MRLGLEIEEITDRFNNMVKQKDYLKLSENVDRRSCRTRDTLADQAHAYGREKIKRLYLNFWWVKNIVMLNSM
ncbi:hypothetical protein SLA2020_277970 [Shorea laevis]